MAALRVEKAYEKHAWIILFALGILGLIGGLAIIFTGSGQLDAGIIRNLTGMTWEEIATTSPGIASLVSYLQRTIGVSALSGSVLLVAIAAMPYRKGERWSWYVLWVPLAIWIAGTAIDLEAGASLGLLVFDLVFAVVWLTGLLLPSRKFFPKKQASTA